MKKIAGNGIQRSGLNPEYEIPFENMPNLVNAARRILTMKQKQDVLKSLRTGGALGLRRSKTQAKGLFLESPENFSRPKSQLSN